MRLQQRSAAFWEWFTGHDAALRLLLEENHPQQAGELIKAELVKIFPEALFEVYRRDGRPCMELMPMGEPLSRIIMSYLIEQAPEAIKRTWNLYSARTAKRGTLSWNGIQLSGGDIRVVPLQVKNSNKFKLKLFCDKLSGVKDKEKFTVTYLMLYEYIGEELCEACIQEVEYPGKFSAGRYKPSQIIPLDDLEDFILKSLQIKGKDELIKSGLIYEYYSGKPQTEMTAKRYDITEGYTALMALAHEYYDKGGELSQRLEAVGAQAWYLSIATAELSSTRAEQIKRELVKVLGRTGALIGFAQGERLCYFDLLMYSGDPADAARRIADTFGIARVEQDKFTEETEQM